MAYSRFSYQITYSYRWVNAGTGTIVSLHAGRPGHLYIVVNKPLKCSVIMRSSPTGKMLGRRREKIANMSTEKKEVMNPSLKINKIRFTSPL